MDWIQIGSALMLVAMLFMIFPRAKAAVNQSPKGTGSDWMGSVYYTHLTLPTIYSGSISVVTVALKQNATTI